MKKILTVVIPAYNSESFIRRCLDSLLVPAFMDMVEILVINDGSKDKTSEIAQEYHQKYPESIYVIDKDNGNYGSVMNVGLKRATGKYFKTLDSDDWYNKDAFEKFVLELEESDADIIFNDYEDYEESTQESKLLTVKPNVPQSTDVTITEEIWTGEIMGKYSIHSITYKTERLKASGLVWPEKVYYSDLQTLFWPLRLCKSIRFVPQPVYVYLVGRDEQSMSKKSQLKNFHSYDIVANNILDEFLRNSNPTQVTYKMQESNLKYIVQQLYGYLKFPSFKNFERITALDDKLKNTGHIYNHFNHLSYRKFKFVKLFRKDPKSIGFRIFRTIIRFI